ncbi:MAG TPA: hypothetical protein DDX98_14065 [Bacteroidales bacterium]|jgi:fermentation-respiration switch protein FrsA (DUF1100 family)|nr:hypothetical protein [Bacteroidales bacterium]
MRKWIKRLVLLLLFVIAAELIIGEFFYRVITGNNISKGNPTLENEIKYGNLDTLWFNLQQKEYFSIQSAYNYKLSCLMLLHSDTTQNTIIVHHGVGADKYVMLKVAPMYLRLGFNVLLFDSRGHGLSGGKHHSYGYYEKHDLERVVNYAKGRFTDGFTGIHGESMGAATTLLYSTMTNENLQIDFIIEDCAYSDLKELFTYRLKEDFGLPNLLFIEAASLMTRIHDGYWFRQVKPIRELEQISLPILFIHGLKDDFVPTSMGQKLYHKKQGAKSYYWASDAAHAVSFNVNKVEYEKQVNLFLSKLK